MDVEMPGIDGITATRRITETYPEIHVLGFSSAPDDETRQAMLEAGATGYLVKGQSPEEIIYSLHALERVPVSGPGGGSLRHGRPRNSGR